VWIRENAEAIAFTGAKSGSRTGQTAILEAFDNVKRLLIWELNLNVLTNAYEFIPSFCSALLPIFAGRWRSAKSVKHRSLVRVFSLNVVVARFQALTTFGAGINRLYTFAEFRAGATIPVPTRLTKSQRSRW